MQESPTEQSGLLSTPAWSHLNGCALVEFLCAREVGPESPKRSDKCFSGYKLLG